MSLVQNRSLAKAQKKDSYTLPFLGDPFDKLRVSASLRLRALARESWTALVVPGMKPETRRGRIGVRPYGGRGRLALQSRPVGSRVSAARRGVSRDLVGSETQPTLACRSCCRIHSTRNGQDLSPVATRAKGDGRTTLWDDSVTLCRTHYRTHYRSYAACRPINGSIRCTIMCTSM